MKNTSNFDVIIVGGSYSGLSAAMSLGRALRSVLIIDSRQPCNAQTPHSHNFLTQDGSTPSQVYTAAKEQVAKYGTIEFYDGLSTAGTSTGNGFNIQTQAGDTFTAKKLIFATGLQDILPPIRGFAECWGISVIHCPYCHGYEVRHQKTGILSNGDLGFEFARMVSNWTKDLTLFTNGKSTLSEEQEAIIKRNRINIVETEIELLEHGNGVLKNIVLKDGSKAALQALYTKPKGVQHCDIPAQLGCEITEDGFIKVDAFQKTTVPGIFASGDNCSFARAISVAVSTGTIAGVFSNRALIEEAF